VLTGDVAAAPGGISNPGDNPFGLRSALCGATFSATLGVEIDPATFGPLTKSCTHFFRKASTLQGPAPAKDR